LCRLLRAGSETIAYDLLVLASGTEMSFDSIPGLAAAQTFFAKMIVEASRQAGQLLDQAGFGA